MAISEIAQSLSIPGVQLVGERQEAQEGFLKRLESALVELSSQNMQLHERLERLKSHKNELEMVLQAQIAEAKRTLEKANSAFSKQLEDNVAVMNTQHERFTKAFSETQELHEKRRALDADLHRLKVNNELLKSVVIPCEGNMDRPGICPAVINAARKAGQAIL